MKLACMILAYGAAPVLKSALPILRSAGWDVFVHLDRKVRREIYLEGLGESAGLCRFVENPIEVFWGGYSMIEAEMKLIETARGNDHYDKFLLLSDNSFPALPPAALAKHFSGADDQISIEKQKENSPLYVRYGSFCCYDHPATTVRGVSHSDGQPLRSVDETLENKIAEIAVLRKLGKKNIDIFYGSQFWALTSKSVDHVRKVVSEDLHLRKSFEVLGAAG